MIQPILFFVLGALCATFVAVMAMPALWRRALRLTHMRMEASMPVSLAEIQADKDRMRAQFAMETRRLEMTIKTLRDRVREQTIEIERSRMEPGRQAAETATPGSRRERSEQPGQGGTKSAPAPQSAGEGHP